MNTLFNPSLKKPLDLPATGPWRESRHQFDELTCWAIRASLAAERPLLIRGECGISKSQLARAAAEVIGATFLSIVVNERTESEDLLYHYDAVSRLAQAQVAGAYKDSPGQVKELLAPEKFIKPGILWWAFNYKSAKKQFEQSAPNAKVPFESTGKGSVILIDEIDKADSSVPNSLLESLDNSGFHVPHIEKDVKLESSGPLLVIITTNEERELPAAFLRRCFVLKLDFPKDKEEQTAVLLRRAKVHFKEEEVSLSVQKLAAKLLIEDRNQAKKLRIGKPGIAEYLDTLRALKELFPGNTKEQEDALESIAQFAFNKHPDVSDA